ncbi:PstS family phosphate ABC transporter substrate-binding protein [Massilia jejuensis]|uniref:PstS family phosphate ABC transporter substrate-binding protein n=1 Tax=Massilia jejuensis TaxID=648894 RepID=A0ABW0PLI7_9BURK
MSRVALRLLKPIFSVVSAAVLLGTPAWSAGLQAPGPIGDLTIGGTGAALGTMQKLADEFKKTHPHVTVKVLPSLGSGGGIKALMAGHLTVSVSSRPITAAEKVHGIAAMELARTPFVFATGLKTPATNVTLDELAALYSGKSLHWSDGTQVRPVLRPLVDVDTQVVKDISPALAQALAEAHQRPGKNIAITDTDSADELENIPGAFGTSTLSLIMSENRRLKVLAVGGVNPTIQNASSGKYPYLKSIYLVMPANPSPVAQSFVKFIDSSSGRTVLSQMGNIPVLNTK